MKTPEDYIELYPFLSQDTGSLIWHVGESDYPIQSNACCIKTDGDLDVLASFSLSRDHRIGYCLTKGAKESVEGFLGIDPKGKDWADIRACFFAEIPESWKQYFGS